MKTKLICAATLALAASFGAFANPTASCLESLGADPQLKLIADKVALARSTQASPVHAVNRVATPEERLAVATWQDRRQQCFAAGSEYRSKVATPQEAAFVRSVFVFQQRLVADLQSGRVTYSEFKRRRLELIEAAGQEI
jgi:hypothetical protein